MPYKIRSIMRRAKGVHILRLDDGRKIIVKHKFGPVRVFGTWTVNGQQAREVR